MTTHIWIAKIKRVLRSDHYLVIAPTQEEAIDKAATATDTEKSRWTASPLRWFKNAETGVAWLYETKPRSYQ